MAERLPFGQITPGAQPIGAFFQKQQANVADALRPQMLGSPSLMTSLQKAGTSNVQGFNQFAQIAEALGPFSKGLMELTSQGIMGYAKGQIESGYYDELKNQQARSVLSMQLQQEQGATNAAAQVNALQKVDPAGAQLLQESNPWRAIGRRRALAQMAGSEIGNVLMSDLSQNAGALSGLAPGSPELMQRKVQLSQAVMNRYGLTGDEPEAAFYVTPKLNKAWDEYSDKHRSYYEQELEVSTVATTVAGGGAAIEQLVTQGVTINGQTYMPGTEEWAQYGAVLLTQEFDKQLGTLAGTARIKAVKELKEQLLGTFGQDPLVGQLLNNVREGNAGMPFAKRPTWGASSPLDVLKFTNEGLKLRQEGYDLGQKAIEQGLDGLWYEPGMPGALLPSDPGYAAALINFRNKAAAAGHRNIDGYIKGRADATEAVAGRIYQVDPLVVGDFESLIETAPPNAFTDAGGRQELLRQARQIAQQQPTPELQASTYARLREKIDKRAQAAEEFTPGVDKQIKAAVLQDLALPPVKAIADAGKSGGQNELLTLLSGGADAATAVAGAFGNAKLSAFTQRVQNGMMRSAEAAINEWYNDHPGQSLSPAAKNRVVSQAIADYRKGAEYAESYQALTGMKPGEVGAKPVGPAKPGPAPNTGTDQSPKPVSRDESRALSDQTARAYSKRPVMEGAWLYKELQSVANGKPVSAELYNLAKRGKASTTRYLLDQLKFYPQLDPKGTARKYLDTMLTKQRQGRAAAQSAAPVATPTTRNSPLGMAQPYNPLRPGGWLMSMLTPRRSPASFITPGVGGDVGEYQSPDSRGQSLASMASRLGVDAGDLAAVFSYETGGTLNPSEPGRGAAAGRIGLIQAGPNERAAYGLGSGNWNKEMVAVEKYLRDRGVKPGMGLADIYAAVNGGNVGAGYKADGNGVVARAASTQAQLRQHRTTAMRALGLQRRAAAAASTEMLRNVRGIKASEVGSGFGAKESFRRHAHEGIDLRFGQGTKIGLTVPVTVVGIYRTSSTAGEANGGYGNYMDVRLPNGNIARFAHLSEIPAGLRNGSRIPANALIARTGGAKGAPGSGRSTGPHLHAELLTGQAGREETLRGKLDPIANGLVSMFRIGS